MNFLHFKKTGHNQLLTTLFILAAILFCACASRGSEEGSAKEEWFPVTKVVDGDTFWINDGSEKGLKVRLIGIDAPESRKTGRKEVGYFGKEAKEYLTRRILGNKVRLEFDVQQYDRYRRTLAYVYLSDGTFLNEELLRNGYAMVMTVPPNVKHADEFVMYQQEARKAGRGLWNIQ